MVDLDPRRDLLAEAVVEGEQGFVDGHRARTVP
jgi:hypothetical protein